MNIHNMMEDKVFERVNLLYDQVKDMKAQWMTCDCEQCRQDAAAYVLNRLPPKYVVSGRGVIYNVSEDEIQLKADIDALTIEAIRIVSSVARPYHNTHDQVGMNTDGTAFNFPTFFGTVYDGNTFEPLRNAKVSLKFQNHEAQMLDYTWANPYTTSSHTKSAYTFWVKPQKASKEGLSEVFHFTLEINAEGYESITYSFDVPLVSEHQARTSVNSNYSLRIQDLFLFPENTVNPMK